MDTLPNVNTRRGGENPSSAGLTSCALPEAQGAQALRYAQKGNPRTLYLRIGPNGLFSARHTDAGKWQSICSKTTT